MSNLDINPISIQEVIDRLPPKHSVLKELPRPKYQLVTNPSNDARLKLGLAVHSMSKHTSNEGMEIFQGLEENGYILAGHNLQVNVTDVSRIVRTFFPSVIVIQDPREWEGKTVGRGFDIKERFTNTDYLNTKLDVFKVTILKDAHQDNGYQANHANEMGIHAWVCYYHPLIVKYLAPFVRYNDLIRTYHTINKDIVPTFSSGNKREGCLLSGAVSSAYPLRSKLVKELANLSNTTYYPHPGYIRTKCYTPEFMKMLSNYKVSICTSSMYGYSIRKIMESTVCGCRVLTDLAIDDKLPHIDDNLVRIHPDTPTNKVKDLIQELIDSYDQEKQVHFSNLAKEHYDFRVITKKLAQDIEDKRLNYASS